MDGEPPNERRMWRLLFIGMALLFLPVLLKFLAFELGDEATIEKLQRVIDFWHSIDKDCQPCEKETGSETLERVLPDFGAGRRATAILGNGTS